MPPQVQGPQQVQGGGDSLVGRLISTGAHIGAAYLGGSYFASNPYAPLQFAYSVAHGAASYIPPLVPVLDTLVKVAYAAAQPIYSGLTALAPYAAPALATIAGAVFGAYAGVYGLHFIYQVFKCKLNPIKAASEAFKSTNDLFSGILGMFTGEKKKEEPQDRIVQTPQGPMRVPAGVG